MDRNCLHSKFQDKHGNRHDGRLQIDMVANARMWVEWRSAFRDRDPMARLSVTRHCVGDTGFGRRQDFLGNATVKVSNLVRSASLPQPSTAPGSRKQRTTLQSLPPATRNWNSIRSGKIPTTRRPASIYLTMNASSALARRWCLPFRCLTAPPFDSRRRYSRC